MIDLYIFEEVVHIIIYASLNIFLNILTSFEIIY